MLQRLGIFGGSFNPVHVGHCIMAEHFVQQMRLDRCLFVPTSISPFKQEERPDVSAHHRLQMLQSVCRRNATFGVDDCEIRRGDVSYTIDTLEIMRERYPQSDLFLLIGSDQAKAFTKWRRWQDVSSLAQVCIARRPFINADEEQAVVRELQGDGRAPILLDVPFVEISSHSIRERIAESKTVRYLVPDSVLRHIRKHKLYRGNESNP